MRHQTQNDYCYDAPASSTAGRVYSSYLRALGARVRKEPSLQKVAAFIEEDLPDVESGVFPTDSGFVAFAATTYTDADDLTATFRGWLEHCGYTWKAGPSFAWETTVWVAHVGKSDKALAVAGRELEELVWFTRFRHDSTAPQEDATILAEIRKSHTALAKFGLSYQARSNKRAGGRCKQAEDVPQALLARLRPHLN